MLQLRMPDDASCGDASRENAFRLRCNQEKRG
jgi:hypothetical protein